MSKDSVDRDLLAYAHAEFYWKHPIVVGSTSDGNIAQDSFRAGYDARQRSQIAPSHRVGLILAKVEILKLKADDYNWQCHVPKEVKDQLEKILSEIDELLK